MPHLKLPDWFEKDKLCWINLSRNPNAIDLLRKNIDKINYYSLCDNPNSVDIFCEQPEQLCRDLDWGEIVFNKHFVDILTNIENFDKRIDWISLMMNETAIDLLL